MVKVTLNKISHKLKHDLIRKQNIENSDSCVQLIADLPHCHLAANLVITAMIPFCEFGGNMSVMGVNIEHFEVPFCNSFRPKILLDQLCYQVDPNEYKNKID